MVLSALAPGSLPTLSAKPPATPGGGQKMPFGEGPDLASPRRVVKLERTQLPTACSEPGRRPASLSNATAVGSSAGR
jgi:hypothetical protein